MPDIGFGYRVGEKGGVSSGLLDSLPTKMSRAIKFAYTKIGILRDDEKEKKEGE